MNSVVSTVINKVSGFISYVQTANDNRVRSKYLKELTIVDTQTAMAVVRTPEFGGLQFTTRGHGWTSDVAEADLAYGAQFMRHKFVLFNQGEALRPASAAVKFTLFEGNTLPKKTHPSERWDYVIIAKPTDKPIADNKDRSAGDKLVLGREGRDGKITDCSIDYLFPWQAIVLNRDNPEQHLAEVKKEIASHGKIGGLYAGRPHEWVVGIRHIEFNR